MAPVIKYHQKLRLYDKLPFTKFSPLHVLIALQNKRELNLNYQFNLIFADLKRGTRKSRNRINRNQK